MCSAPRGARHAIASTVRPTRARMRFSQRCMCTWQAGTVLLRGKGRPRVGDAPTVASLMVVEMADAVIILGWYAQHQRVQSWPHGSPPLHRCGREAGTIGPDTRRSRARARQRGLMQRSERCLGYGTTTRMLAAAHEA